MIYSWHVSWKTKNESLIRTQGGLLMPAFISSFTEDLREMRLCNLSVHVDFGVLGPQDP